MFSTVRILSRLFLTLTLLCGAESCAGERETTDPVPAAETPANGGESVESLLQRGLAAFASEEHTEARAIFEEATRRDPRACIAYLHLGDIVAPEDRAAAIAYWYNALKCDPGKERWYGHVAAQMIDLGELGEAEKILLRGVANVPESAYLLRGLAHMNLLCGRSARAARLYERVLMDHPGDIEALCQLAMIRIDEGGVEDGGKLLAGLPAIDDGLGLMALTRARLADGIGDAEQAARLYAAALEKNMQPYERHRALRNYAALLSATGRDREAGQYVSEAIELEDKWPHLAKPSEKTHDEKKDTGAAPEKSR